MPKNQKKNLILTKPIANIYYYGYNLLQKKIMVNIKLNVNKKPKNINKVFF